MKATGSLLPATKWPHIERDPKPVRHRQRLFETGGRGELVGIDEIVVIVHCDGILVVFQNGTRRFASLRTVDELMP